MKVLVFLPLLSLVSMGSGCFVWPTAWPTYETTTTPTPKVTRLATPTNTCTGADNVVFLSTVPIIVAAGGNTVSGTAVFTGTGTQKVLCYAVSDKMAAPNQSTFQKTAGDYNTATITVTATSANAQAIAADVYFYGTP